MESLRQTEIPTRPKKNTYRFTTGQPNKQITISSDFDSGNICLVKQITQLQYRLSAVPDTLQSSGKKCWFYFKVRVTEPLVLRFTIQNVGVLIPGYQAGVYPEGCVYKDEEKDEWKPVPTSYMTTNDQAELVIDYYFRNPSFVYFALTVPFSYYDQVSYLEDLDEKFKANTSIYYHKEVIIPSALGFDMFVIYLSQIASDTDLSVKQDQIHERLFPQQKRPVKIKKPVVFINCRIHPGQATASHTLCGIIQFLTGNDIRAFLLRKLFLFVIVPMANPDGVFQGNYRMCSQGVNLNRVYNIATPDMYPQVFGIKSLVEYYSQDQRLQFYFDMHGHTSPKGAFIYGNAMDNLVWQVQSELFCKLMAVNSKYFSFGECSFAQKHMSMKDKNEPLSKQGCSRVVLGKSTGIIHCLTLETGIYKMAPSQEVFDPQYKEFQLNNMSVTSRKQKSFVDMFHQIGEGFCVSLLDRVQKNPFSRLGNTPFKNLETLRKQLAFEVLQNQERFKMLDIKAYQKAKFITKYSNEAFTDKINRKWAYLTNLEFQSIVWPNDFDGFKLKAEYKEPVVKPLQKTRNNNSQTKLAPPSNFKRNPKQMTPVYRFQRQTSLMQEEMANRVIEPIQIIFNDQEIVRKKSLKDRSSTRKLLRDFSNQKERIQNQQAEQRSKMRIANPTSLLGLLGHDQMFPEDFKERMVTRIVEIRKNSSLIKKVPTRFRTDLVEQAPDFLVISNKKLSKCTTLGAEQPFSTQQPQESTSQLQLKQHRLKKIRSFKRQILNAKLSDMKKKTSLRLPQIQKNFRRDEPLNLQELRKDIEAVKLISVTSYHLTKERFN